MAFTCSILALLALQAQVRLPADSLPAELGADVPLGLAAELFERHPAAPQVRALGRELFFDPILSADGSLACASCHDPRHGFASPDALAVGIGGALGTFNAPTLFNRVLGESFLWDGRAATLEQQVLMPLANPIEMGESLEDVLARLAASPTWRGRFDSVFGEQPSAPRLAEALAGFVRLVVHGDSPVDRFRAGDAGALTESEQAGLWIFESSGRCWRCHSGPNFSDESFHNTGVGVHAGVPQPGRAAVTGDERQRGAFKTPTLRGLIHTPPYMHDGSLASLAEVVEFYRRGGIANERLDPLLQPLEMSDAEAAHLVAFLRALSGPPPVAASQAATR